MSDKIDIVKQWIEKGDHDLGTAQVTSLYLPKYRDTIAFHCQQAAEKYLKGYLMFLDIPFQKKHSLNYLLGLISAKIEVIDEIYDNASILEDFAIEIRYPDTHIDLSDEDIQQAFQISKLIRKYVLNLMSITIDYEDVKKE
jgi:HEPN domain-containing protein